MGILEIKLIIFMLFIAASACFAASEIALTSLTTITIGNLKKRYPKRLGTIALWEQRPNEVLAVILIGTNLALVGTSVVGSSLAIDFAQLFGVSYVKTAALASVVIIGMTLVFGELMPKIFSRFAPERISITFLPILSVLSRLARPVSRLLIRISERIISVAGSPSTSETPFLRPEELKVLLLMDDSLPISNPARNIIGRIIDFSKARIGKVMVPRTEMQVVSLDQSPEKVISQIIEKGYSRVPVYRGNIDNIVGIIYSRDLLLARTSGALFLIDDLVRPAYFVPVSARIDRVLRDFKTGHQHMAVVVDEFGATVGLATIEDLVEEIVGEIWDEYDIQMKTIVPLPDNAYLIKAGESLDHINAELGMGLPAAEFSTVSAWVLDIFGRIPRIGETARWGNLMIEIIEADQRKVVKVRIKKVE